MDTAVVFPTHPHARLRSVKISLLITSCSTRLYGIYTGAAMLFIDSIMEVIGWPKAAKHVVSYTSSAVLFSDTAFRI